MSAQPLTLEVLVARIPTGGKHFRIEPGEEERRSIAEALEIVGVTELTAELEVRPVGEDAFAVHGTLHASVVQTDVVTLEPIPQEVSEAIDLTLVPADGGPRSKKAAASETEEAAEDRDVYRRGRIDLGAIVLEHLALGLDPYPKAPGIEFPGHVEDVPDAKASPFSALATLKRDGD